MKFLVVFPIADLRRFQKKPPNLVSLPDWFAPEFDKEHIRALGAMKQSSPLLHDVSGLRGWVAEPHFCSSASGLKFANFGFINDQGVKSACRVQSRRFFFDSDCCARLEFEFEVIELPSEKEISARAILEFLSNLKISVRKHLGKGRDTFDSVGFGRSGALFASALVERTGRLSDAHEIEDQKNSVFQPRPMIFMEAASGESITTDAGFKQVANTISESFVIHHDRDRIFSAQDIPVWIVNRSQKAAKNDIRDFSLFLRRYFCDVEVSKIILRQLIKDQKTNTGQRFGFNRGTNDYLFELLKRVLDADNKLTRLHHHASATEHEERNDLASLASISLFDFLPGIEAQFDQGLRTLKVLEQRNREKIEEWSKRLKARSSRAETIIQELNSSGERGSSPRETQTDVDHWIKLETELDAVFDRVVSTITDAQLVEAFSRLVPSYRFALEKMDEGEASELIDALQEYVSVLASKQPRSNALERATDRILSVLQLEPAELEKFRVESDFVKYRALGHVN